MQMTGVECKLYSAMRQFQKHEPSVSVKQCKDIIRYVLIEEREYGMWLFKLNCPTSEKSLVL